jgi:hypothetical protein
MIACFKILNWFNVLKLVVNVKKTVRTVLKLVFLIKKHTTKAYSFIFAYHSRYILFFWNVF